MKLLLDTNIIVMLLVDERRLPPSYLNVLRSGAHDFEVSAISIWEIAIQHRKGKLVLGFDLADLESRLLRLRIGIRSLSATQAISDPALPDGLKDPFDRMIVAIAEIESTGFLTTDAKLLDHPLAWRP